VGINNYNSPSLGKLETPAEGAEAIAKLLETHGKFQVLRQNSTVTQKQLKDALLELFTPEGKNIPETALFYFFGYGLRETRGIDQNYLASSDANPDEDRWGISLEWLRKLVESSPIKQQIVLLDCCHSGELFNFNEANPGDRGLARDRCFIAASREFEAAQVSLDSEYSVLTQALLQGLDPQRQANITNFGLVDYLDQQLGNNTQRPIYSNFGEPIILTRAIIPPTPPHLPTPPNPSHSDQCPYKGLRYFDITDADYFFGREDLIIQLFH
jgi:uncharacterized caspase-like protein